MRFFFSLFLNLFFDDDVEKRYIISMHKLTTCVQVSVQEKDCIRYLHAFINCLMRTEVHIFVSEFFFSTQTNKVVEKILETFVRM